MEQVRIDLVRFLELRCDIYAFQDRRYLEISWENSFKAIFDEDQQDVPSFRNNTAA